ncbi:hypothetical protein ACLB1Q_36900 [Escherichia coli]
MYRTPRNFKKLNVIDEGWRLLDFKHHKVGEFIEQRLPYRPPSYRCLYHHHTEHRRL